MINTMGEILQGQYTRNHAIEFCCFCSSIHRDTLVQRGEGNASVANLCPVTARLLRLWDVKTQRQRIIRSRLIDRLILIGFVHTDHPLMNIDGQNR